ncbi:class F sortase [Streptomyces heilongjiangensis]|uniref:Sortase domain-bontaining protein n=1 Tax=Streptomyces heilongjiangensis TaxID=945052 RepID=A0ABW1BDT8_9ACTN|nr:class F sortase [Streptomyces heilongjiangensis]MDC2951688.1 sortase [Streptomyces heilongjiangensis]
MPDTGPGPWLRRRLRTAAIVLLAVSGATVLALAPSRESLPPATDFDARTAASPPATPPVRAEDPGSPPTAPATSTAPTRPASAASPRWLDIERVGLHAAVEARGVAPDGSAEIPEDPQKVGWYRFGPAPGAPSGSAVMVGHVDSRTGDLGAFAALFDVRAGDEVTVRRTDAPPVTYRVVARVRVDKDRLPASTFARTGRPVLTMITCAPPFDPERGGYQRNLVVTALPVTPTG